MSSSPNTLGLPHQPFVRLFLPLSLEFRPHHLPALCVVLIEPAYLSTEKTTATVNGVNVQDWISKKVKLSVDIQIIKLLINRVKIQFITVYSVNIQIETVNKVNF